MSNPTVYSNGKRKLFQRKEKILLLHVILVIYYIGVWTRASLQKLYGIKCSFLDRGFSRNPDRPLSILPVTCQKLLSGQKKPASPNPKPLRCFNKSNNHKNIFSTNRNHPTGSIPKIIYIIYQFIINFILVRILA